MSIYTDRFYQRLQRCQLWQESVGFKIISYYGFKSVVDFGCGNAYYLNGMFKGKTIISGYEYSYDQCKKYIPSDIINYIQFADLSEQIKAKKHDMAMSMEVAEHIPENKSDIFISNMIFASDNILFSAAIPGQGGTDHINEQHREYWINKFEQKQYLYSDEDVNIIRDIFNSLQQKSKYINVMKRNIMFFRKKI